MNSVNHDYGPEIVEILETVVKNGHPLPCSDLAWEKFLTGIKYLDMPCYNISKKTLVKLAEKLLHAFVTGLNNEPLNK